MIMPSRWYAGGKGLDEFRNSMLNDSHIGQLDDFLHPEEILPDTNNRGGICYFLWNKDYDNSISKVNIVSHNGNGEVNHSSRSMKTRDLDIFLRDNIGVEILDKVLPSDEIDTFSNHISAAKAFGFRTFFIINQRFRPTTAGLNDPVMCYGRSGKKGYVESNQITSHRDWIDLWKVYVAESNNIGTELNDDNQNAFVGCPNTICTETFLVVGADLGLNEISATNLVCYLKTKFARFLLSLAKISQHATAKTYRFVPVQDFTEQSDINWNEQISKIDAQLYAKYGLTQDEIDYIESKIKPMN